MGVWVANGCIAVATVGARVETGLLRGEGEKNGGAPCSVLSNLKWLTSQAVNQAEQEADTAADPNLCTPDTWSRSDLLL